MLADVVAVLFAVSYVRLWWKVRQTRKLVEVAKDLSFAALVHDHTGEAWPEEFVNDESEV